MPPTSADIAVGKATLAFSGRALPMAYGLAHGGKTLFWTASDLYFTFYMTEVCGVSPARTGLAIGTSFLFAAGADLVLAHILAHRATDGVSAARMQALGAFATAAALLLFAATSFLPSGARLGACVVALFVFRAAYALLDVPQNALLALAAGTERERATLAATRNVAGALARTALALAFIPLMAGHERHIAGFHFRMLALLLSIVAVLGAAMLKRQAARSFPIIEAPAKVLDSAHTTGIVMMMMFTYAVAATGFIQVEPYLAAYGIADRGAATAFMGAIAIGYATSQPMWLARSIATSQARLLVEALVTTALGSILLVVLIRETFAGSTIAGLIYGMGTGGVLFALWTGIARDAARGCAIRIIGRFTAVAKFGQGLAVIAVGVMLEQWVARPDGQWLAMTMAGIMILGLTVIAILASASHGQRSRIVT